MRQQRNSNGRLMASIGYSYIAAAACLSDHKNCDRAVTQMLCSGEMTDPMTDTFAHDPLTVHDGEREVHLGIGMGSSLSSQKAVAEHSPKAQITFDRYRLTARANSGVNFGSTHRIHDKPDLKSMRWMWLKNTKNLKPKQQNQIDTLKDCNLRIAAAFHFQFALQDVFSLTEWHQRSALIKGWLGLAKESAWTPMVKIAYTMNNHWESTFCAGSRFIRATAPWKTSTACSSQLNPRPRAYSAAKNFNNMAYFVLVKMDLMPSISEEAVGVYSYVSMS